MIRGSGPLEALSWLDHRGDRLGCAKRIKIAAGVVVGTVWPDQGKPSPAARVLGHRSKAEELVGQ